MIQVVVQKCVPQFFGHVRPAFTPLAALVNQPVEVAHPICTPFAVQRRLAHLQLRPGQRQHGAERFVHARLTCLRRIVAVSLPLFQQFAPQLDLCPFIGGIILKRFRLRYHSGCASGFCAVVLRLQPVRQLAHRDQVFGLVSVRIPAQFIRQLAVRNHLAYVLFTAAPQFGIFFYGYVFHISVPTWYNRYKV